MQADLNNGLQKRTILNYYSDNNYRGNKKA